MKSNWGGVRTESKVIEAIHDQWCRDNGYRITKRATKSGRAAPQYGKKSVLNKAKMA
jgi:hypothetical protein